MVIGMMGAKHVRYGWKADLTRVPRPPFDRLGAGGIDHLLKLPFGIRSAIVAYDRLNTIQFSKFPQLRKGSARASRESGLGARDELYADRKHASPPCALSISEAGSRRDRSPKLKLKHHPHVDYQASRPQCPVHSRLRVVAYQATGMRSYRGFRRQTGRSEASDRSGNVALIN